MKDRYRFIFELDKKPAIRAIKAGLVMIIPVLMTGSFALILKSLPIWGYLNFIHTFGSGILYNIFDFVYAASFGMLSVYMTVATGYHIAKQFGENAKNRCGAPLSALAAFLIFTGFGTPSFNISSFGPVGMFTAIVCATTASWLYLLIAKVLRTNDIFSDGSDPGFNRAIATIIPLSMTCAVYALVEFSLCALFRVDNFWALIVDVFTLLFEHIGNDFIGGLLYVLVSSLLWFFGIHGSDVLESVNQNIFIPAAEANVAAVAAGGAPTEIYTKTFFDVFVLMGGCGTLLCLLIALLLFSKRKCNRSLAKFAAFPMLFNINEIMVFGLPIIYNPIMFVPFILAPLVSFLISSAAIGMGLVPLTCRAVEWTTPIILGGYQATGSIAGAFLQLVNLTIGTAIYIPFVRMYDAQKEKQSIESINDLTDILRCHESENTDVTLTEIEGTGGDVAKQLVHDLRFAIEKGKLYLEYQPQFDNTHHLVGAEALLRWKHPVFGMIYPPLAIKLADESGQLLNLEKYIFKRVSEDAQKADLNLRISINATAKSMGQDEFIQFLINRFGNTGGRTRFCVEITEQNRLVTDAEILRQLHRVKEKGLLLAIDDFSMGFTSLKYLQESDFDIVKLDGSLVRNLVSDKRSGEIISSIVYLSKSMGFSVLAEFVETEDQRRQLEKLGCTQYQGYLFSKAVSLEELDAMANVNDSVAS